MKKERIIHEDVEILDSINNVPRSVDVDEEERRYVGASSIGHPCLRKIQLDSNLFDMKDFKNKDGTPFIKNKISKRVDRIFKTGHLMEKMVIEALEDMYKHEGLPIDGKSYLRTHDRKGKQFGFSDLDGRFRGHIDGTVRFNPPFSCSPLVEILVEIKTASNKNYNKFLSGGIDALDPSGRYRGQIAIYQAYMELDNTQAFFVVINKDTSEIAIERIRFNQKLAQALSDKARTIVIATDNKELMPKHTDNDGNFVCRFCDYKDYCF